MASLADDLLNDLEDDSGSDQELESAAEAMVVEAAVDEAEQDEEQHEEAPDLPEGSIAQTELLSTEEVAQMQLDKVSKVSKVCPLIGGQALKDALKRLEVYKQSPVTDLQRDRDQYQFVVKANNLSVEIDNEMLIAHKFARDHYAPRFPELESLVTEPLSFCKVVLLLGNSDKLDGDLKDVLPSGKVMAVKVTAATTKGVALGSEEWKTVEEACDVMFRLDEAKRKMLEFVESRISMLAPNTSAIVGTQTATKILGIAGGLESLSRMPSANIYLLGAAKTTSSGFSTASHSVDRLHTGFIYASPLVQSARPEDRMKAQRKVSAKVALAVRVDISNGSRDGDFGREQKRKLEKELERLAEPPPTKTVKALPRPDDGPKKRRGGKRARAAKEAQGITELRKKQNRMRFGEAEEEIGAYDETSGLGMIGNSGGKIRAETGESRSRLKMNKANKARVAAFQKSSSSTSGLATSLAFTPAQGIELINPGTATSAQQKVADANARWFADGTFTQVRKEKGLPGGKG